MIAGVMRLADRAVSGLITPRRDVDWIDVTASESEIKKRLITTTTGNRECGTVLVIDQSHRHVGCTQDVNEVERGCGLGNDGRPSNVFKSDTGGEEPDAIERDDGSWLLSGAMMEVGLATTPGVDVIRSTSFYGLSFVRVTFNYGVDYYFALQQAAISLPQNVNLPGNVTPSIQGSSLVGDSRRNGGPSSFGSWSLSRYRARSRQLRRPYLPTSAGPRHLCVAGSR
jgi:hypothetical protein